jgi:hypothetical protein
VSIDTNLFLYLFKKLNNFQFCKIYGHLLAGLAKLNWREFLFFKQLMGCRTGWYCSSKRSGINSSGGMRYLSIFSPPFFCLIRDRDPESRINIPDPQHCQIWQYFRWFIWVPGGVILWRKKTEGENSPDTVRLSFFLSFRQAILAKLQRNKSFCHFVSAKFQRNKSPFRHFVSAKYFFSGETPDTRNYFLPEAWKRCT